MMQCKCCEKPLPPLAVAYDDPYCSRVCLELDLYGHTNIDEDRSLNGARWSGRLKAWSGAQVQVGQIKATLRALGFSAKISERLGVGTIVCHVCNESLSGDISELEWLAVDHVKTADHPKVVMDSPLECRGTLGACSPSLYLVRE